MAVLNTELLMNFGPRIVPLLARHGKLAPPAGAPLFFLRCSLFANFSLPKLWSVNINGWLIFACWNLKSTPSQLLKTPACPWHLVSAPSALDKFRALWLGQWSPHLVGRDSPHFEEPPPHVCLFRLCHQPPSGRHLPWEVSHLASALLNT